MDNKTILLSHGSGGKQSQELLELIYKTLEDIVVNHGEDSGTFKAQSGNIALTTDSYTIDPIFFPGGNIGKLAICGTLNDLAMVGAVPKYITLALMIEEGFNFDDLKKILLSVKDETKKAGVSIIAGDTKVVSKGKIDKIFINTAGYGIISSDQVISSKNAQPDDAVIVTGEIGDHGAAIMAYRNGFESSLRSDCANVAPLIKILLEKGAILHVLRDPTRGGLASILNEIASSSNVDIEIDEEALPLKESVTGVCDALGIDPLYMACEGRAVIVCPQDQIEQVLENLHEIPLGKKARCIGRVIRKSSHPTLYLKTFIGATRILPLLSREQTPRIC
ncbi:MAG: hydrogenase expression/formation protein HypE [Candidatus Cloacimonetes bacterium]|nr:hydrogenase expression/formation protein HypE [Candidatus Cloacimonadota bacterium]